MMSEPFFYYCSSTPCISIRLDKIKWMSPIHVIYSWSMRDCAVLKGGWGLIVLPSVLRGPQLTDRGRWRMRRLLTK